MELNLLENLKKDVESKDYIKQFIGELNDFISNNSLNEKESIDNNYINKKENLNKEKLDKKLQEHRKEGHLYLVTEDRNNEIYLWDFTDKPKHEFKEIIYSKKLLDIAKEGTMLQYINGKYELYSPYGYDMLFNKGKK